MPVETILKLNYQNGTSKIRNRRKMRLIFGDSQDCFYEILKANSDKKIVLVSDPPFNINYKYNTYSDKMNEDEYYSMLNFFFKDFPSVVVHYPEQLFKLAFTIGKFPERVIAWVYNSNTAKQHRDIAFFDVKPDMSKVRQPYKNPNDKRIKERILRGGYWSKALRLVGNQPSKECK